jgi:hypothetical protein
LGTAVEGVSTLSRFDLDKLTDNLDTLGLGKAGDDVALRLLS